MVIRQRMAVADAVLENDDAVVGRRCPRSGAHARGDSGRACRDRRGGDGRLVKEAVAQFGAPPVQMAREEGEEGGRHHRGRHSGVDEGALGRCIGFG